MSDKILITGDFNIPAAFPSERVVHLRTPINDQDIYKNLSGIRHYIVGGPEYVDDKMMSQAPDLKHIVVMGTGTNSFVDLKSAFNRGIQVDNTPGINADSVAEYALGAIIFNAANSVYSRENLLNGGWYQKPHKTLNETTFGIIGLGDIGSRLAARIRAIAPDAQISYFSRTRKEKHEQDLNIDYSPLKELSQKADVLVLCVTYSDSTNHIINKELIETAKPGIMLFNFSNPLTVDPNALKAGLQKNQVGFSYFDGYYNEWIKNEGLANDSFGLLALGSDKFIATSHIAAQADAVIQEILGAALKKVMQWKPRTISTNLNIGEPNV